MKFPKLAYKILIDYFRQLTIGFAVVILFIGYLLLIAPKISEVRSAQLNTRQLTIDRLNSQQEFLNDLSKSNLKFSELFSPASLKSINDFLPSDPDFPGLLLTVKNIVIQSGMSLDNFAVAQGGQTTTASGSIAPVADQGKTATNGAQASTVGGIKVKTQDVSISVSGGKSYESLKNLLAIIESSRRLFDVVSLDFSFESADITKSTVADTWTIVLRSYYLPS